MAKAPRSDAELREAVENELGWDARVRETDVQVQVSSGVVALTGTMGSWAERSAAQDAAHRVAGVLDVVNDIEINLPAGSARDDLDLAHAVRRALQWDALVPDDDIESTVVHGTVTLTGQVDYEAQRQDAERAVRNLLGIYRLNNQIRLKPAVLLSSRDVKHAIEAALERRLARELSQIEVAVDDGHVCLSGAVASWAERRAALGAAAATPGVRSVDDHLRIAP